MMTLAHVRSAVLVAAVGVLLNGCPPVTAPTYEIILDNQDVGVTLVSDGWQLAPSTDGNGGYGPDFLYHAADRAQVGIVRFIPRIAVGGTYTVSIYWSAGPDRTIDQPVLVHDAIGDTVYHVNFQEHGHAWYELGTHTFAAGTSGYVEFTTETDAGLCIADAVRWSSNP